MFDSRYKAVKAVLWIILFANFMVAGIKIGIGLMCGSQSVLADGIHSCADGSSNIVGLIGIWLASKPKDAKHQYGHGKYEILASLLIGVMLAVMSVKIMYNAIISIAQPVAVRISLFEALLMLFTISINTIVAVTEYAYGKRLKSTILITDSLHTKGDIMISCVVLLGLISIKMGFPAWIDGVMSIMVTVAVLLSAWKIVKSCTDVLVDSAAVDSDEVRKLLMTIPGVYDVHKVRSRGEASHIYIELHVIVSPQENVTSMHELLHRLEAALKEQFGSETEVNIHPEPDDGRHGM